MSADEGETNPLQELYIKAASAKRSLTRSKKDLQLGLRALQEAPSSSHFFDELLKYQAFYRERRTKVYDIYDKIEEQISDELFKKDFGKQCKDIEKDYDALEEEARVVISRHQVALDEISANISQARSRGDGGADGRGTAPPGWKLQSSFEPKPSLRLDMGGEELANWERQFKMYFDISNLQQADIGTQRAVLLNCLHPELQVKLHEDISGILDIKAGLAAIRDEFKRRHPRVVRRHNLFSIEQKKDEYSFSDTVTRLDALARDADLTDMTKDSILCHLMLRACKDDALRAKMLEVPEDDMTQIRLKEVIDLYEIIERTNKGLSEKEKAKRAKAGESSICYRCQGRGHFATECKVPEQSLFCRTCSEHSIPLPHSHNYFPGCKGKKKEDSGDKKEETEAKEVGKSKRAKAKGWESPAGQPESSDSEDEQVQARRVKTEDNTHEDVPAGDPESSDTEADEDDPMIDSGWASSTAEEEEEEDVYFGGSADFVQLKVRSKVAADPETSWAPAGLRSNEKGISAVPPRGRSPPVAEKEDRVPVREKGESVKQQRKMQCNKLAICSPKIICGIAVMVVLLLFAGFIQWLNSDGETTNNVDPKVSGDNNKIEVKNDNKKEISLLHIDNLASSQRTANGLMIGGFVIILLIAATIFVSHQKSKAQRRREKARERMQMMDKIQAVEDEMIQRGFMARKKIKKSKKTRTKNKKVRRSKKTDTDIEAKEEQSASSNDDSD